MAFFPFTQLNDDMGDAGDLVSVEVFQAIARNCNYLIDAMPVGSIIPVLVGFGSCPTPDPTIWKELDGTEIDVQASALRNQLAPDYAAAGGRYMRGYVSAGTIGNYGGSNTKNLVHDHGGTAVNAQPKNADSDDDFVTAGNHAHGMSMDLQPDHNFEPVHFRVKHYLKIA